MPVEPLKSTASRGKTAQSGIQSGAATKEAERNKEDNEAALKKAGWKYKEGKRAWRDPLSKTLQYFADACAMQNSRDINKRKPKQSSNATPKGSMMDKLRGSTKEEREAKAKADAEEKARLEEEAKAKAEADAKAKEEQEAAIAKAKAEGKAEAEAEAAAAAKKANR